MISPAELKNDYEDAKDEVRKLENAVEQKEKDCSKELSKAVQVEKDKIHALLKEKWVSKFKHEYQFGTIGCTNEPFAPRK